MTERSVEHATFVVERTYNAPPAQVFSAWADPTAKRRWFGSAEEGGGEFELDFREDGRELNRGAGPDGRSYTFEARYHEILPEERIVYAYDMHLEDTRISVSLATVQLEPEGDGTLLTFTEQGAFLDGHDTPAQREQGTGGLLDALGAELRGEPASA
jgi:uncharacterized protein YndB with AHSA1/START domain